jgi:hypothetical protein
MYCIGSSSAAAGLAELDRLAKEKNVTKLGAKRIDASLLSAMQSDIVVPGTSLRCTSDLKIEQSNSLKKSERHNTDHSSSAFSSLSSSSSALWYESKLDQAKAQALQLVRQTISTEATRYKTIRKSLCNTAEVASARWEAKNELGVILSMKKFMSLRSDYETLVMRNGKLQNLYNEITLGDGNNHISGYMESVQAHKELVEGHQNHIVSILNEFLPHRTLSDADLVNELVSGLVQEFVNALPLSLSI